VTLNGRLFRPAIACAAAALALVLGLVPAALEGYPRPKGASVITVSMVPAYVECTGANSTHGDPLAAGSCSPPTPASSYLTVGTPDFNGKPASFTGNVRLDVITGNPATPEYEAELRIKATFTDLRSKADLSD
jgi:hypothetical protein